MFGQLSVLDLENSIPMIGAVTDGESKLEIKLQVGRNYDKLWPPPVLTIVSADDATNIGGNGTITTGKYSGNRLELDMKAGIIAGTGTASAVYQVPDRFIRFGTDEENDDKFRSERQVQLRINYVGDKLPTITLKRPPLVLIHGIWGSAKETWKGLKLIDYDGDKRFDLVNVNYKNKNADAVATNSPIIGTEFKQKDDILVAAGILPGKYDVVVHSMGGLLLRDFCGKNADYCISRIRKAVTVDTPHKGSSLANMIIVSDKDSNSECYKEVLEAVHAKGKAIWEGGAITNRTIIKRAISDLAEGSDLLKDLPELPIDWTAVIGITEPYGVLAYDPDIGLLTQGIEHYCKKDINALLTIRNDRIVSYGSQKGNAINYYEINEVDHSTVVISPTLENILKNMLEKNGR